LFYMSQRWSRFAALAVLVLLAGLVLFLRLPALPQSVIDWDESIYLLMARSMLQGHAPYTVIWDHKPPGLYMLFVLAQILFGQTVLAMRLLAVLAVTATTFLLWLYGRSLLGGWAIGALAALFYALFSLQNGGMASNAEILLAPFTTAAFLLLGWRTGVPATIQPGRRLTFLAVGLLLGAAIQIKTVAGMELLAALALLGLTPLLNRRTGRPLQLGETALAAGLVVVGALLPLLAAAGAFAITGHFADYFYANFTATAIYLRAASPQALAPVARALLDQARGAPLLWLAALAALPLAWIIRRRHPRVTLDLLVLGVWLAFALAAPLLSRRLFPHYFLQVLPPLSLLAAAVIVQAVRLDSALPRARQALLISLIVAIGLVQPAARPLRRSLEEAQALLRRTPRVELLVYTAGYLRERMAPDDTLFIAEGEPILYYLTGAPIPTRYALPAYLNRPDMAAITGIEPLAELERIMALRPRYVVLLEEYQRDPAFLDHLQAYLAEDYLLERSIQGILLYRLAS
jgi:4-amino-4-deoxy-L-arabinose transferase-like glycosyltransferase